MIQNETLRVVEPEQRTESPDGALDEPTPEVATRYDDAYEVTLADYESAYTFPNFITAVMEELGKDFQAEEGRLIDDITGSEDVDFGLLLAFEDESLLFVGSDPTAKDSVPWFAFIIEPTAPYPAPETAQDALDLLKPPRVKDMVYEENWLPDRHGEWWLLPCELVPAGTVFNPGVSSKPFGPSPLGNHVPREYAFTVSDTTFMDRFREATPKAPQTIETPPEVIAWTCRQLRKVNPPDWTPRWADIRAFAGDVLVRGTIRHRDDDHFVENLGEQWHLADTHDVEVYTGDEMATRVHLDYHGR